MTDRLNEKQLENIRQKRQEVERLREGQDIQSIKNIMSGIIEELPSEFTIDSKTEFESWVHDQLRADYVELPSICELLHEIILKKRGTEKNPDKREELLGIATDLVEDGRELNRCMRNPNGEDTKNARRNLHKRIVRALDLL